MLGSIQHRRSKPACSQMLSVLEEDTTKRSPTYQCAPDAPAGSAETGVGGHGVGETKRRGVIAVEKAQVQEVQGGVQSFGHEEGHGNVNGVQKIPLGQSIATGQSVPDGISTMQHQPCRKRS